VIFHYHILRGSGRTGCHSCVDKIKFVLSVDNRSLNGRLEAEIRELNTLRNWITHGKVYKRVILGDEQLEGHLTEVDRDDSVDWSKSFPNTKFSALDELDESDARTALKIALEAVGTVTLNADIMYWFNPFVPEDAGYKIVHQDMNINEYLDSLRYRV
jgi:hypothetical protein